LKRFDEESNVMARSEPIVELCGIAKQFGGIPALRHVDVSLFPGEIHALVGENGAGKSTLVKMLAGVHRPDNGYIKVQGQVIDLRSPMQAQARGIAVVHQEPMLFPDLDIAENVFIGRHPRDRLGRIDWKRIHREVNELLATLHVSLNSHMPVQGLSIAEQQLVEIAKALALDARVLVLDEPSAALSSREVDELFTIVRSLQAHDVAILFVSHRLEEVFALADRVTILRDGTHIITAPIAELNTETIIKHMVGRELTALFPKGESTIRDVVLEAKNLTRKGSFEDVSFQLRQGEILGFAGLVGAGRTEVARVLFGIDQADAGQIFIKGKAVHMRSSRSAMRHGIAYVPEDRHQHGLVMDFSIAANMTLSILPQISRLGLLDSGHEQAIADDYTQRLHVRSTGLNQLVKALSGGNQQKVVLGKWLATNPSILILDEPTRGIDIGAKAEVYHIVSDLAADGMAIILISSELPEVLAMADRILVMHEGLVSGTFSRSEADQASIMFAATGQARTGSV
jgi:rhamnose transport system ATP-binding protein